MNSNVKALISLYEENPDLPIICMVDGEICYDDYASYCASFGSCSIEEYAIIDFGSHEGEMTTDKDYWIECYYDSHDDELTEKFNYHPRMTFYHDNTYTQEQIAQNTENEKKLDNYLYELANKEFKKAIIVNIVLPDFN